MKANHIPASKRLEQRIIRLQNKFDSSFHYEEGNPYLVCNECDMTEAHISINDGHDYKCKVGGIQKEVIHYKRLLEKCLTL